MKKKWNKVTKIKGRYLFQWSRRKNKVTSEYINHPSIKTGRFQKVPYFLILPMYFFFWKILYCTSNMIQNFIVNKVIKQLIFDIVKIVLV